MLLPIMIFANWCGFSGGSSDMAGDILESGAMIVNTLLCKYDWKCRSKRSGPRNDCSRHQGRFWGWLQRWRHQCLGGPPHWQNFWRRHQRRDHQWFKEDSLVLGVELHIDKDSRASGKDSILASTKVPKMASKVVALAILLEHPSLNSHLWQCQYQDLPPVLNQDLHLCPPSSILLTISPCQVYSSQRNIYFIMWWPQLCHSDLTIGITILSTQTIYALFDKVGHIWRLQIWHLEWKMEPNRDQILFWKTLPKFMLELPDKGGTSKEKVPNPCLCLSLLQV